MGYSINPITNDCYEGTTCLINKLGIKDEKVLKQVEGNITFAKWAELETNPISFKFDFDHYKAIHKYLFEDLYDWAGTIRKIDISKKGTNFVPASDIENVAKGIFGRLQKENFFRDNSKADFIDNIVDFYSATNMLHPFREGNGRTQRAFITQLIRFCGYDFDFSRIDSDELMIATIKSANGDDSLLKELFSRFLF